MTCTPTTLDHAHASPLHSLWATAGWIKAALLRAASIETVPGSGSRQQPSQRLVDKQEKR